jgi:glycosyltransferase involved in cell wall biosynthesis
MRPFSRRLYDGATHLVLVPCRKLVEEARAAGLQARNGAVVDGSVDLERFRPGPADPAAWAEARLDPGSEVVSLVARLAPVKGVGVFLEAFARVRREAPGAAALLLGEAWEGQAERFEADVERLGLRPSVRWLGRREDVPRWLRLARVAVVSSVGSELHSRSALEAMASGLPLAATRVGVLPEWLEGRPWARLAPPGDAPALAGAILELLASPDRAGLGAQARQEAEARFSPARMVDRVEALLGGLAETS